ncbi:hypothetical protein PENTCL1PPCAC_24147, partial [Pristionchus entomophagus]
TYVCCRMPIDAESGAQSDQHQLVVGRHDDKDQSSLTSAQMLAAAVVVSREWAQRKRRGGSHEAVLKILIDKKQLSIAIGRVTEYVTPSSTIFLLPYLNSLSEQGLLVPPQEGSVSSELSPQSFSESHIHRLGMHLEIIERSEINKDIRNHTTKGFYNQVWNCDFDNKAQFGMHLEKRDISSSFDVLSGHHAPPRLGDALVVVAAELLGGAVAVGALWKGAGLTNGRILEWAWSQNSLHTASASSDLSPQSSSPSQVNLQHSIFCKHWHAHCTVVVCLEYTSSGCICRSQHT